MVNRNPLIIILILVAFTCCKPEKKGIDKAIDSITSEDLKKQISVIASYDFQGRAPSTTGEKKSIAYLADQLKQLGLKPAKKKIFESAGPDYNRLAMEAIKRGFKPGDMKLNACVQFKNQAEHTKSNNITALWPGTDRADEYNIYNNF
jgi:hypothetical protein